MQHELFWTAHLQSAVLDSPYPVPVDAAVVLGREANCEIPIKAEQYPTVSRFHAKVQPLPDQPGSWQVCDLNASNGTYLNGVRLQGCQTLKQDDCIALSKDGPQFIFTCQQVMRPVLPEHDPVLVDAVAAEPPVESLVESQPVEIQAQTIPVVPSPAPIAAATVSSSTSSSISSSTSSSIDPAHKSLWDLLSDREEQIFSGHADAVRAVGFSPTHSHLASGSADKTIRLWCLNGTAELTLSEHKLAVSAVAFSPEGQYLASGSADKTIKLWDLSVASCIQTLTGHSMAVHSLAFSPDGKTLVSGSADKTIKLWDVNQGIEKQTLSAHKMAVNAVAFSRNGQMFVSGSADKTIKLWDFTSGTEILSISLRSSPNAIVFSPDDQSLAISTEDKTIRLWSLKTGQEVRCLPGQPGQVGGVAISLDGRYFASSREDHCVRVWTL